MMDENEINKLSLDRLLNLQKLEIGMLKHSIIRDDLYTKNDILIFIKELYIINSVIKSKVSKTWKKKKEI